MTEVKTEAPYDGQTSSAIYMIVNMKETEQRGFYIGSASNLQKRIKQHFKSLNNGNHHNINLQNAFNRYGKSVFKVFILQTVKNKDHLIPLEDMAIKSYKPGYNMYLRALEDPLEDPLNVLAGGRVEGSTIIFINKKIDKKELVNYELYNYLKMKGYLDPSYYV